MKSLKILLILVAVLSVSPGLWAGSGRGTGNQTTKTETQEDVRGPDRYRILEERQDEDYFTFSRDTGDPNCNRRGNGERFLAKNFTWGPGPSNPYGTAWVDANGFLHVGPYTLRDGQTYGSNYQGRQQTYSDGAWSGFRNVQDYDRTGHCWGGIGGDRYWSDGQIKNTGVRVFDTKRDFAGRTTDEHQEVTRNERIGTSRLQVTIAGGVVCSFRQDNTHVTRTTYLEVTDRYQTTNFRDIGQVTSYTPIILDLSGTGKPDVSHSNYLPHLPNMYQDRLAMFDFMGTGVPILTEWVGPKAGLLCTPDKNGTVTSALDLFGSAGGWNDGFDKLEALYDKNHEGVVRGDALKGLAVWIDKNGNAKVDPGEIVSLDSLGIVAISVKHNNYESSYQTKDGIKHKMWDWFPSGMSLKKIEGHSGSAK